MFQTTEDLLPNRMRRLSTREQPLATIIKVEGDGAGEIQHLTFRQLDTLSNKAAWFLDENVHEDRFLYMGTSDIRYLVWVLAAMKTGKCVVFPAPGNTVPANLGLFGKVGAKTLLYAPELSETLQPLFAATKDTVKPIVSQTYRDILSETEAEVDPYPFTATWDEAHSVPFLGLHTSGTSGHPKPLYWTHAAWATAPSMYDPEVYDMAKNGQSALDALLGKGIICSTFPTFHFGGIAPLLTLFFCESTLVLPYPGTRLTTTNILTLLEQGKCTKAFLPPVILEAMVDYPFALETLSKLDGVAYAGGAVNPARGEVLAKHTRQFFTFMASTEGGPCHSVAPSDTRHWNHFKWVDVGQRLEEVAPGFFELVFPRTDLTLRTNAFFHTMPHLETEYRTADLYSPVEGEDGWWIYRGRADNWMTLSTGLKMDPTDMENTINSHPDVLGSLVTGSYRVRPCLLVELKQAPSDGVSRIQALDDLWPTIAKANEGMPKLGHIPRELVVFATNSKPFFRASKGTVQRVLTASAYAEEIDSAYAVAEESLLTGGLPPLESTEAAHLVPLLTVLFTDVTHGKKDGGGLDPEEDLFAHGVDSLGISVALSRLRAALRNVGIADEKIQSIKNQLVYKSTTIRKLASAISAVLSGTDDVEAQQSEEATRNQLLEKYEQKVQDIVAGSFSKEAHEPASDNGPEQQGHTVILTGSTGSVGSYILASLLARKDVKRVYCLNRGSDAAVKQTSSFRERGLPYDLLDSGLTSSRVVFLRATLHAPLLGLSETDYDTLAGETTAILHNAYPVNFLLDLCAFEPQLQGLVNLLQLGAQAARNPAVFFVSSVSAGVAHEDNVIPEAVASPEQFEKRSPLVHQGYAQSKWICERMLEKFSSASSSRNRKAAVLRVGQVCGPLTGPGTWNPSEWAPSLVLSSRHLGARPLDIGGTGEVDWVPVDTLGVIVVEVLVAFCEENVNEGRGNDEGFKVFNIMNPQTTPWSELVPALEGIAPEAVSAWEWIARLEKSGNGSGDRSGNTKENPGLFLLDFYKQAMLGGGEGEGERKQRSVKTEKTNLLRASETARNLKSIERRDVEKWMKGWGL
ncbi:hypothetical protein F5Y17DRAFT_436780 [Xylariaceae sp. FL0594]|nr:hypothetical protein F5Y17DRAFT_436780 [Xylariaceae sp. FL0594]